MYKVLCYRLYDSKKKKVDFYDVNRSKNGSFYLTFKSLDEMARFSVQSPSICFIDIDKGDCSIEEIRAFKQKVLAISQKKLIEGGNNC